MSGHSYPVRIFTREQRRPAGHAGKQPWRKIVTVGFDDDMLAKIVGLAEKSKCSMAEQIRTLVEWGLESCEREQLPAQELSFQRGK